LLGRRIRAWTADGAGTHWARSTSTFVRLGEWLFRPVTSGSHSRPARERPPGLAGKRSASDMIDRIKTRAWLLGVTVLPVVLAVVILPMGRRWA